jgi:hypothetical protein
VEKPWLAAYPAGVPADIDPDRYASLAALFEQSFERFGKAPAFTNLGATLTFSDVDRLSRAFAAYLQALPGMRRGDRPSRRAARAERRPSRARNANSRLEASDGLPGRAHP